MDNNKNILIIKYLSGNASEEEKNSLFKWINESTANTKEFREAEKIWERSINLKISGKHNTTEAWEDFKLRSKTKPHSDSGVWFLRAAASIAFLMIAAIVVRLILPGTDQNKLSVKKEITQPVINHESAPIKEDITEVPKDSLPVQEKTGFSKNKKAAPAANNISTGDSAIVFLLPDSTKVYLNKNSRIHFASSYGKKERRVELVGEAYFEVNHLATPFLVACNKTIVHDIGTSFNIRGAAKDSLVEVSVITGSVEFYPASTKLSQQKVLLVAGNSGIYHAKKASIQTAKTKKGSKWWKGKGIKNRLREFFDKLKGKKH